MSPLKFLFILCICSFASAEVVKVGQTLTLSGGVQAGTTPITFTWTKDAKPYVPVLPPVVTPTTSVITVKNAQLTDAGTYVVTASNAAGNEQVPPVVAVSTPTVITVEVPTTAPVFTLQPASQTIVDGQPVTFAALATGTPAPTYQWLRNGTSIAGATSASYTIPRVTMGDVASYSVNAGNSAGSVRSKGATLTVTGTVVGGASVTVTVSP